MASVSPSGTFNSLPTHIEASNSAVLVHQLSKGQSQSPFRKSKGLIQRVLFHPSKPIFFVATQQSVRVYNLVKQEMIKKLQSGCKWISSMDIHPSGMSWTNHENVML
jgi:ribosome biogenesis protein ERB1